MQTIQQWLQLFTEQVSQTSFWEWAAVLFGVTEVLLAKVNNIWLYPTGIIGTTIGIYMLIMAGLYAESALSVYYIVMSFYGWYHWVKKRNEARVNISRATKQEWVTVALIVFVGWVLFYFLLTRFTTSTVPVWDAWVTSTAWAGMWLLAKRKLENWILLNVSNLFAIPLLFHKHLIMFAALTLFLFIVAIFGYFDWRAKLKTAQVS
ncbi:nicotinamide riboside transporter PnuC [Mucilaginibacter antarcticus]|uniref:Nicotinamide riboside transporter PnuC n=1 Tax=Mucilaginibacter antarcticus TaxID=1855725 RepID=A0ABW5XIT0_9SPHI